MEHFVVVYDRSTGMLVSIEQFDKDRIENARTVRASLEIARRSEPEIEVVLLGADSEETLRRTHSRYFESPSELASA